MQEITYQLFIQLRKDVTISVGKLGQIYFPAGNYIYTGSARKNMQQRVARHLRQEKTCRWHIDYLLVNPCASVSEVSYSADDECVVNQRTPGKTIIHGFGASDCKHQCGAHLKYLGK